MAQPADRRIATEDELADVESRVHDVEVSQTTVVSQFDTVKTRLNDIAADVAEFGPDFNSKVNKGDIQFNVIDYGAEGDGVTDDKDAFQQALDAAHSAGGGTVFVPAGRTYVHRSIIIIRANTRLSAYGATLKREGQFAWVRNFLKSSDSFPEYSGESNIVVEGGTWLGGAEEASSGTGNVFSFAHCQNILVRDVIVNNATAAAHGIELNAVKNARIVHCQVNGFNTLDGTTTNSEAFQLDSAGVDTWLCNPADDTPCQDIVFDGCSTDKTDELGYFGRFVGSHFIPPNKFHDRITVTNCTSYGTLMEGIRAYQYRDSVFNDNIIYNAGSYGIQLTPGTPSSEGGSNTIRGSVISGNLINGGTGPGIQVRGNTTSGAYAPSVVITGNKVSGCSANGIEVRDTTHVSITGNEVWNAGANGIAASNASFLNIVGNGVHRVSSRGIILSPDASDCSVRSNMVTRAGNGAYRASANANYNAFVGNTARLDGGSTGSGMALSITSTCAGTMHYGNDFYGYGSSGVSDSGSGSVTSPDNRT